MNLLDSPYFGLLRERLDQLSQRQRLIAENIANASTPGYVPRDVDTAGFERALAARAGAGGNGRVTLRQTQAGHMAPGGGALTQPVRVMNAPDSETTLDGNAVVLEEQTLRASQTRTAFETGLALYQKGLQLVRLAARPPGR